MPLRPWIYVIARNKCLDHLKRKKALAFSTLASDETSEGIEERIELIEGDIRSFHIVREAVDGVDVIFHEAALPSVPRSSDRPEL